MIFRFLCQKIVSGVVLVSSPRLIGPAVDHLADLALWEAELAADGGDTDAWSVATPLVQRLRRVPDPRRARGRRHPLVVILVLTACATLVVGNDSVTAIWQWVARTPQEVLARLGARFDPWHGRHTIPSERTFRRHQVHGVAHDEIRWTCSRRRARSKPAGVTSWAIPSTLSGSDRGCTPSLDGAWWASN